MATEKQIAANQANAQKSTGPRTDEGKAIARVNATTHGMTASRLEVFETLDEGAAQEREAFAACYAARDAVDASMIDQLATASLRMKQCWSRENLILTRLIQRADDLWNEDRHAEVKQLADRLHKKPGSVQARLLTTAQGCDFLIEGWESLLSLLDADVTWTDTDRARALNLLGIPLDAREGPTKLDPKPGSDQTPVAKVREVVERELARLRRLRQGPLGRADSTDRHMTGLGFPCDPPQNLKLVLRYEHEASNRFSRLMNALQDRRVVPESAGSEFEEEEETYENQPEPEVSAPTQSQFFPNMAAAMPKTEPLVFEELLREAPESTSNPRVVSREEAPGLNRVERKALARQRQMQPA